MKTEIVRREFRGEEPLEIPVATIDGASSGPIFTVISGMHAGEYSGVLAAQRLIQTIVPGQLSGTLKVVPVISTRAFMARNMQLSPVDEREVHYYPPGNPDGSYTEFHVDVLYSILSGSDFVIDMHSGEFAQALYPWVPVPMVGAADVQEASRSLSMGYRVEYVELRRERSSVPRLASYLADDGIANLWAEVGKNGLPDEEHIAIHHDGVVAAMQTVGMLPGEPERPPQKVVEGRRFQVNANQSGVWHSYVREGEIVEAGQELGRITDYFGDTLEVYLAPERALVLYYWSSPAIDHARRPHGYDWHAGLVSLLTLDNVIEPAGAGSRRQRSGIHRC